VTSGGAASYTLTVTNHGPADATDSVVTDVLPDGLDVHSPPAGCTLAGRTLTCALGTLAAGATRTITLAATLTAAGGTSVQNCASATTSAPDIGPANDESCAQTAAESPVPPSQQADLVMTKVGPGELMAGDIVRYMLTVTNNGPGEATDATITDVRADNLANAAGPRICTSAEHATTCSIGTLAPGESRTVVLTTRIDPATAATITGNCVTALSSAFDPDPSNAHSCAETIVERPTTDPNDADLAIVKSGTATVRPGNAIRYTLNVVNHGPGAAHDTVVGDTIPDELSSVTVPAGCGLHGRILSCRLGTLAAGTTRTFAVTGTLAANAAPGSVVENCATTYTVTTEKTVANNASCTHTSVPPGLPTVPVTG
jgi:uncharacterized repeat protein (TIGR01451 family)